MSKAFSSSVVLLALSSFKGDGRDNINLDKIYSDTIAVYLII